MAGVCTEGLDTGFVALGYAKVAFLGVVQGITELLPVSSTAHMRVVPALLGWRDPGSAFSAAMQLAALAAVVSYFWTDVRASSGGAVSAIKRRDFSDWSLRFCVWIALATLPIIVAGSLLSKLLNTCNSPLRSLSAIGVAYIVMGVLLALAEIYSRHKRTLDHVDLEGRDDRRLRPMRRADPRRLALRLDLHGGAVPRPRAHRGGALLLPARHPGHCRGRAARNSTNCTRRISTPTAGRSSPSASSSPRSRPSSRSGACCAFSSASPSWPFAIYRVLLGIFLLVAVFAHWLPN